MSDHYTVDLYFNRQITDEEVNVISKRLNRAYYKDSIDEEHTYLQDEQTEEEEQKGIIPDFDISFERYYNDNSTWARLVGVELSDDGDEVTASFTGWECCRDAVKAEAKKIMKEINNSSES